MYAGCDFHLFTGKDFVAKVQVGSTLPFRGGLRIYPQSRL